MRLIGLRCSSQMTLADRSNRPLLILSAISFGIGFPGLVSDAWIWLRWLGSMSEPVAGFLVGAGSLGVGLWGWNNRCRWLAPARQKWKTISEVYDDLPLLVQLPIWCFVFFPILLLMAVVMLFAIKITTLTLELLQATPLLIRYVEWALS